VVIGARLAVAVIAVGAAAAGPTHHITLHSETQMPVTFNQGVARVADGWILSGTNFPVPGSDVLVRTDEQLVPQVTNASAIPLPLHNEGYVHIGDIDVAGDVIYAPLEQRDYTLGHQRMARYDAKSLAFIDSVEVQQHENSFVAVDAATMTAWSQDRFDGDLLLRYDIKAGWKPLPPLKMSKTLHHTQGAAVVSGGIWISTSDESPPVNGIYFVDTGTGLVELAGTHANTGEGEGADAHGTAAGQLHTLVNDANLATTWFEHWDVTVPAAGPTVPPAAAPAASTAPGRSPAGGTTPSTGWPANALLLAALATMAAGRYLRLRVGNAVGRSRDDDGGVDRSDPSPHEAR
jgi:hypothetical protein